MDLSLHIFKTNNRCERYLIAMTVVLIVVVIVLLYIIFAEGHLNQSWQDNAICAMIGLGITVIILTVAGAWKSYLYACETQVEIDPVKRIFVYTHRGKTIRFCGGDVAEWLDTLGLKIGFDRLTRLTEHDSVMILKSGETVYLPSWLWDGDYFWTHASGSYEHNIKFYLEAHYDELGLPESKMSWTYKYMFP